MSLLNIDYGSIASSETLNKNFSYLNEKITEDSAVLTGKINSMISNIATINTRLGDSSAELKDSMDSLSRLVEEKNAETETVLYGYSMLPRWSSVVYVEGSKEYRATSNGYLLITGDCSAVTVSGVKIELKSKSDSELKLPPVFIPLMKNDTAEFAGGNFSVRFVPAWGKGGV